MPKTVRHRKPKKNKSLEFLKAISDRFSSTLGVNEEIPGHAISGLMSQYMGLDPETGEVGEAAWHNLKASWDGHPERKRVPGLVSDTLSMANMFGNGPEWAKEMQRKADNTHDRVREDMGLDAPEGFANVSADAAGTIAGQLLMPTKGGKSAVRPLKDFLTAIPEYFSPTTEARLGNFVSGGLGMGAIDSAANNEDLPRILQQMFSQDDSYADPRVERLAKGGKASKLSEMLRAIVLNPDARATRETKQHLMGDPLEEVLYAARQGVERGKLSEIEHQQILETLAHQDNEEQLQATLAALHAKLFPTDPKALTYAPVAPVQDLSMVKAPAGHGTVSDEEWNAMIERRMKPRR